MVGTSPAWHFWLLSRLRAQPYHQRLALKRLAMHGCGRELGSLCVLKMNKAKAARLALQGCSGVVWVWVEFRQRGKASCKVLFKQLQGAIKGGAIKASCRLLSKPGRYLSLQASYLVSFLMTHEAAG
eukprot:979390-Pelagomonas_calceolata.AAC.7